MPVLVWDNSDDRVYESGLDRGVLYLPDGSGVPWNGLTSVIEKFDKSTSPVYYDGMKISDLVVLGDFSASLSAVTYPDEFSEIEGLAFTRNGLFFSDQPPKTFGLCYRTQIGNDGSAEGYKIHVLYNLTAIPSDKTYATMSVDPSLVEFEWSITAIPEEIAGLRPTAHLIINTIDMDPLLLEELESVLYGAQYGNATLLPMPELITLINNFFRFEIIDHGDGTWSAITEYLEFIDVDIYNQFNILGINAWYLDNSTYVVASTRGVADAPQIKIHGVGDGTWTAHTEYVPLITTIGPGEVQILNANINVINAYTYEISDTPEE